MQSKNDRNIFKIAIFSIVFFSLINGIAFSQIVTDRDLWQQIQGYGNASTEDRAALKSCYAQLSTLFPNSSILDQALYFYSQYWERKGLQNDAVKLCKRIINTYPNSSYVYPAYLDIMRIYQDRENKTGLTQIYTDFKAYTAKYLQYPELTIENKADVYLQLGYYAQVLKQPQTAQKAFIQAYQLAPNTKSGRQALYYTGLS
ncbi:MAG: tol-pal system YbgF family protein [bacterium]